MAGDVKNDGAIGQVCINDGVYTVFSNYGVCRNVRQTPILDYTESLYVKGQAVVFFRNTEKISTDKPVPYDIIKIG